MHESFSYYLDHYGPILDGPKPEAALGRKIRQWVPASLANFLCDKGFIRFHDGLLSLCDPDEFRVVLSLVFGSDPDFRADECHVIGFSAFGVLECWSDRLAGFQINLPEASVHCRALTISDWHPQASRDHLAAGIVPDSERADFLDIDGEPMFQRCMKAHGRLGRGECFAFVPALAIAGTFGPMRTVRHIERTAALEHFVMLAQLARFHLVAVTIDDIVPVRVIGPPAVS